MFHPIFRRNITRGAERSNHLFRPQKRCPGHTREISETRNKGAVGSQKLPPEICPTLYHGQGYKASMTKILSVDEP